MTTDELFLLQLVRIRASRREMMAALSRSGDYIARRLENLERDGLIANPAPNQSRTLILTGAGGRYIDGYTVTRENGGNWKLGKVELK